MFGLKATKTPVLTMAYIRHSKYLSSDTTVRQYNAICNQLVRYLDDGLHLIHLGPAGNSRLCAKLRGKIWLLITEDIVCLYPK